MTSEQFKQLSEPFPEAAIQRTKGRQTGKGYDTDGYGYQWIADRFNAVLGIDGWSDEEVESRVREDKYKSGRPKYVVTTKVRITVHGETRSVSREMWGGHESPVEADACKGAFTNAFKKCAAFFGPGAQAYRSELDPDNRPHPEANEAQEQAAKRREEREQKEKRRDHVRARLAYFEAKYGPAQWRALVPEPPTTLGDAEKLLADIEEIEAKAAAEAMEPDDRPDGSWPAGVNPTHDELDEGRR